MTLNINREAAYLAINAKLREIIQKEDETALVRYLREVSPEWAIHVLCRYRVFEDLFAKFFIAKYQIKRNIGC